MRPYVICHMMSGLDGKTDPLAIAKFSDIDIYELTHPKLEGDAWLCGRVTMQVNFGQYADPDPFQENGKDAIARDEIHQAKTAKTYAVCADSHGKISWKGEPVDGDHPIVLTTHKASTRYLDMLRSRGVSYIVAGGEHIDFEKAFQILLKVFGIKRLIVEGGGMINGSVLDAGLIDEFSLLLLPGIDGRQGPSAPFDGRPTEPRNAFPAKLKSLERLADDVLWLRYEVGKRQC